MTCERFDFGSEMFLALIALLMKVFHCKNRKTDLENGQNRKTENPNALRGALGSIKNRKTAIDFDQNRKPLTKPSKPKIYTAQFSPNPSLDLKRW